MSFDPRARPRLSLELVGDTPETGLASNARPGDDAPPFLNVVRRRLVHRDADGHASAPFIYDCVERRATDAVVIVLTERREGVLYVCLRTSLRPPVAFRGQLAVPELVTDDPVLWEVPAGLIEPGEVGEAGIRAAAAREALEETGRVVAPEAFSPLGAPSLLSPGVIAEMLFFVIADATHAPEGTPPGDGSPVEEGAAIVWVTLEEAMTAADAGDLGDIKTELAIRRLAARERAA